MKHFEQLTFDRIAELIGCSPNTAKTRYYRALEKLRQDLRRRQVLEA
jgi:DNA-directed RNA polymerase specialized sigma24 family protein